MAWPTVVIDTTSMDAAGDNPGTARAEIKQMADNVNLIKDSKGAVSGIAELDVSGMVPTGQLPTIPANKGGTGHASFAIGEIFYANSTTTLAKLGAGSSGTVLTSNGAGAAPSYQTAGGMASGTRTVFNQTTAPVGWTKDTTAALNDSIMRIVTGTVGAGGSTAFSTFNGQTSVGATTLTLSQIPSHSHNLNTFSGFGISPAPNLKREGSTALATETTAAQGGGGSHTHTITTAIKYNDFIICQKD